MLLAGTLLALLSFAFTYKNERTITGTVKDQNGNNIAGATITAKETKTATISDANGKFSITIDDKIKAIEVSYVGYKTATVKLTDKSDYTIALKAQTSNLNEVVVVGYSAKAKADVTGSVATISEQDYDKAFYSFPRISNNEEDKTQDDSCRYNNNFNTEGYDHIVENPFLKTNDNPLSTFSIDVDAASYANVRRFINQGELPPAGAVRIEELINYFTYNYPQPQNDDPFSINTEISNCPWNQQHKLVLIGLQGKKISTQYLPASNLVFLIDVSGSMDEPDKLPLVKSSLKLLVDQLRPQDKVSIGCICGQCRIGIAANKRR